MTGVEVESRTVSGHTVIALAGELDFAAVAQVSDELERVLAENLGGLVVDLTRITFLDSAGIGLLYKLRAVTHTRGQALHVVMPPENPVHRTLVLTSADSSFAIHPTVGDATAAAARGFE